MSQPSVRSSSSGLHPVRVVTRRTGLNADVLRAWERRHHAVAPTRTAGGQRLYSDDDIERLQLLQRLTALGHAIGQLAALGTPELRAVLVEEEGAPAEATLSDGDEALFAELGDRALALVEALDDRELETMLRRASRRLGTHVTIERVIAPILREIGERWHRRELSPVHEHLASAVVERTLHWMFDGPTQDPDAPRIALATPEGERHELGIQIAAAVAASEAWRVIYLGADLPAKAIADAVRSAGARVLAISVVAPANAESALREVAAIRAALPDAVSMIVGGGGLASVSQRLARGVTWLEDLVALRAFLRSYRPRRG